MSKPKKKFFDTAVGHFVKGIIRELPIVGGVLDHLKDPQDKGPGKIDKTTMAGQILAGGSVVTFILHSLGYIPAHVYDLVVAILAQVLE